MKLVDYTKAEDGSLLNGRFIVASNGEIPDYSAEQYYGTEPNESRDWQKAKFVLKRKELNFYEYVKAKLASE
jgi:hypothetical protein